MALQNAFEDLALDQTLQDIKDTDGIKKITDPVTITGIQPLDKFGILYATEYGATYNYIAKYSATGAWIVQRETISTGIRDYAFQGNQSPALDPDTVITAFSGRATNDYGQYSE